MDIYSLENHNPKKNALVKITNNILSTLGEHSLTYHEISQLDEDTLYRFNKSMLFRLEDMSRKPQATRSNTKKLEEFFSTKNTLQRFSIFAKRIVNDDVWELATDQRLVEVYDIESGVQILANEKFKEINRYSARELLTHSYHELYHRRSDIEAMIYKHIREVSLSGKTIPMNIPKHIILEKKKDDPIKFTMDFMYISPLIDFYGNPKEIVVISMVKILKTENGVYQI